MGFWKHLLSVDESKQSICIYVFVFSTIYALIEVYTKGDIPPNLLTFLGYLLAAIFGINIANGIGTNYLNRNPYTNTTTYPYNQYPIQNSTPISPVQNQTNNKPVI
jgi:hypothetical protein